MSFLKEYKASLKLVEVEEVLELVFFRPLAFLFVKLIYNTNLTPNHITFLGLIFGIAGGISLAYGTIESMMLAALLFLIFCVLDCSDGQLARLKDNGSNFGRIFDGIADYLASTAAYIGIAIAFIDNYSNPLYYAILIFATAASNIAHAVLVDYYRNRFIDYTQNRKNVLNDEMKDLRKEYEGLKNGKGKLIERIVIGIYLKYSSLQNNLVSSQSKEYKVSAEEYYKNNKSIIHLWTYLGPTTQWSFLVLCLFINKIEVYLWGLVVVFNSYALLLYFVQKRIDKRLEIS